MTRTPRRAALAGAAAAPALAAVLALTLSGCGTPQVGAAATVGDRRISVAEVQNGYRDIVTVVGQDQQITQGQILNLLILEPYLTEAAAQQGRGVSTEDARLDIKSAGPAAANVTAAGLEVWRANLANTAVQTDRSATQVQATYQAIGAKLKKDGVHINPRYGAGLDYTNFSILPDKPNWLVTKAATTATPTPTPTPTPAPTQ